MQPAKRFDIPSNDLKTLYLDEQLSVAEIAKHYEQDERYGNRQYRS